MALMSTVFNWLNQNTFVFTLISFVIGLYTMPFVIKLAIRKQLVVKPNKRTAHKGSIPNVGGLNIFTSFIVTFLLFSYLDTFLILRYFLAGLYAIFIIGFLDDLMAMSAKKKLIGEIFAGLILIVLADVRLTNLHGFMWISQISPDYIFFSYLVSLFLFLLIINSLNLIDGVDGLATGMGILICLFFGIYYHLIDQHVLSIIAFTLIGSLAIFFIYNVFGKRSKIFMGDSGALVLGYIVYLFVIKFCELNQMDFQDRDYFMYAAPAMAVCVLAVPLFDTLRVMITRIKHGESPFAADKNHVHHLLLSIGLKHRQVTFVLVSVNLTFIALAIVGHEWKNSVLGAAALLLSIIYTLIMWRVVDYHKRKLKAL